jgi:ABC-2 type transport system permease protein
MKRLLIITRRVMKQIAKDKRFFGLSLVAPLIIIYFLKVAIDSMTPIGRSGVYDSMVMPVVAAIVFFLGFILCTLALVRERTSLTLNRMFVSGYTRSEIIAGYLLGFAGLATIQAFLAMGEGYFVFNLSYTRETFASLFVVMWLLAIVSLGLGILISNAARTEGQVVPFIPLVLLPSLFLSGIVTRGVDNLPQWAQFISRFIPLRYASDSINGLIKGQSLADQSGSLISLLAFGILLLWAAALTLRDRE